MKQAAVACALILASVTFSAQEPAAMLLVLNKNADTLSIIDPRSGTIAGTAPTGRNPHEVTVSADGRFAITTNYEGHSLSVIDIAARKEVQRVELPDARQPHGIDLVGNVAVFTAEGSRTIAALDPASRKIAWRVPVAQDGTHMVVGSRDGRMLFTSNMGSNSITILERSGESWRQTHVGVGAVPEGLDLSPDGRELWTAHAQDGGVSVVDVATKKVTHRFDAKTSRSNRLKFTRDGRLVFISDMAGGELVIVDARTHAITRRLKIGQMPEGILVPPTGDRVYVAVTGDNRVVAVDVNTLEVVQTIAVGGGPDGMAWAATR